MAHSVRKSTTSAEVRLIQLKNCLVNLPQSLVSILENADTPVQNVIIELQYNDNISTTPNAKDGNTSQRRSIFAGWTGAPSKRQIPAIVGKGRGIGSAGRDSEAAVVEIDATFGHTLGLVEGQKVGLLLHPDPPLAHTINIEPLTPADWEIIELHANFLELNLLSQIRALPNPAFSTLPSVQLQQLHPLTLHLSPTSTANIIVSSLVPPLASTVPFAKIAPDAEVIVAPKIRPRLTDRTASRSIASNGKTSAGGRSLKSAVKHNQKEHVGKQSLFLRPCTRCFCDPFFDEEDPQDHDVGLRVWVDPDQLVEESWRGITYACVSVVRSSLLETPLDPQQQQRKKDVENGKLGSPASKVVAKLCLWSEAPRSSAVALSSLLCSVLRIDGVVGGLVRIEPAPPQIPRNTVRRLKFYPFMSNISDVIKFGGDRQKRHESVAENIKKAYAHLDSETDRLLDGPLTDGLLLPPVQNLESALLWDGGLLRFDFQNPVRDKLDASRICWSLGSNLEIEVQEEVHNPVKALESSNLDADPLPIIEPTMIGIDELKKQLFSYTSHHSSVLLSGGPGSGKSTLACLLGCRLRSTSLYHAQIFSCRKLTGSETRIPTIKETLTRIFMRASWGARLEGQSVIILDDLDRLCPAETELQTSDNGRSRQISELVCSLSRQHCRHRSGVVLLVTAQSKEAVNNVLIESNIIREIVPLKVPDKFGRKNLLEYFLGQRLGSTSSSDDLNGSVGVNEDEAAWMDGSLPNSPLTDSLPTTTSRFSSVDLLDISGRTDGYMPADLALLTSRAHSESLIRNLHSPTSSSNLSISSQDFLLALKGFIPASLRNVPLQSSTTTFASIGGLRSVRTLLLETLQYPTIYAPIFAQCSLRLRSGLLLYGYPGCGKTLLASAVAGECGLNFISVKGPEILNKYIGASEKSVRDLFERAEAARPCVLFFDEFDSIAPKRGHDSTGVTDRVVNQMLTQMDGAEGLSGVYVLAATSRPDLIDPALLRPGRLDKSILCDLPTLDDRLDILQALSKKLRVSDNLLRNGLQEVARRTEGFSGADLQALIYNAHLEAIHDVLGGTSGRGEFSVQKKGSHQGERYGRQNKRSDIMRFRYSAEADEEATTLTTSHAKEIAEYNALVERFRALKKAKQKERQLRWSENDGNDMQEEKDLKENQESREPVIQRKHVEASLAATRKSISEAERSRLQTVYREFLVGRNGQMPDGQGSMEIGGRSSLM
ncbi:MAG: hypothetical protein LQ351_006207 [Letrouitia transgressa]|nr:MAG: hypothetical protein LQ351_006207 [Letrouitia transgressa]